MLTFYFLNEKKIVCNNNLAQKFLQFRMKSLILSFFREKKSVSRHKIYFSIKVTFKSLKATRNMSGKNKT